MSLSRFHQHLHIFTNKFAVHSGLHCHTKISLRTRSTPLFGDKKIEETKKRPQFFLFKIRKLWIHVALSAIPLFLFAFSLFHMIITNMAIIIEFPFVSVEVVDVWSWCYLRSNRTEKNQVLNNDNYTTSTPYWPIRPNEPEKEDERTKKKLLPKCWFT